MIGEALPFTRHIILFVCYVLLISNVSAQRNCRYHGGVDGTCRDISQCPTVLQHLKNGVSFPISCGGFNGRNPIVCCPVGDSGIVTPPSSIDIAEPFPSIECGISNPQVQDSKIQASRQAAINRNNQAQAARAESSEGVVQRFVVGGIPSFLSAWPWMALLGNEDSSGKKDWFCAGSLINNQWVLTAAHCFDEEPVNIVRLGELNYEDPNDGANPIDFAVSGPIRFPNYTFPEAYHDVALLKLDRPVRFTNSIRPVCLPWGSESNRNMDNEQVTLTGWGKTNYFGTKSPALLEVVVTVFPTNECDSNYQNLRDYSVTWPQGIGSESLCSGHVNGGKDACQGDSGGPIVSKDSRNRYTIAGVVSVGYGCGDVEYPGLYANVRSSDYLAWIKKVAF